MRHIARVAAELRRICPSDVTKKSIIEALRGIDGMRAKDAAAQVDAIQAEIARQRQALKAKAERNRPRRAYPLPCWQRGTLEDRLLAAVKFWFPRTMKRGEGSVDIQLTTNPAEVGYRVRTSEEWKKYGRKGYYKQTIDTHHITLPRAYMARVRKRHLGSIDGLVTLDASPLDSPADGVDLYAARWARQGRGYSVETDDGYIARQGHYTYHGATIKATLAGLRRKVVGVKLTGPTMERLAQLHADKWVPLDTVRAVGACEYGIKSWVERVGMQAQYQGGGATVAEVAQGYAICPAPEARAAVIRAVREAGRRVA